MFVQDPGVEADHLLGGKCVEHSAESVDFPRNIFRRAPLCALEHHMLDEMRDAVDLSPLAPGSGPQPDPNGHRVDVLHRLGQGDKTVPEGLFVHHVSCVGHVHFYCGMAPREMSFRLAKTLCYSSHAMMNPICPRKSPAPEETCSANPGKSCANSCKHWGNRPIAVRRSIMRCTRSGDSISTR